MTYLRNVVQMLDLGKHVKKGYLPYDLTDLNYSGNIPPKASFSTSNMNDLELKLFDDWYEQKKNETYILKNEVKEYCQNDVFILTKALIKFHNIILNCTNVEVLFDSTVMTISSLSLKIYLSMTNLKDELGVEPVCGYNGGKTLKNQSKIAVEWLNEIKSKVTSSQF